MAITLTVVDDDKDTRDMRSMGADPILRNTPAVVVTGLPFDNGAGAAGFPSFIRKPVNHEDLMQVIQQNLSNPELI